MAKKKKSKRRRGGVKMRIERANPGAGALASLLVTPETLKRVYRAGMKRSPLRLNVRTRPRPWRAPKRKK